MNLSSTGRVIWYLARGIHQKHCLSLLTLHCAVSGAPVRRPLCLSHSCNSLVNQKIHFENEGLLKKAWKKIKYYIFDQSKIRVCGYYLYETIADQLDYMLFFEEMKLPDTFNSWFLVTELHLWMLMVKSMEFGQDGRQISYFMVEAMWGDVSTKAKKLGDENRSVATSQIVELGDQFQAALLSYDEGLLTDDKVLAGAIWRRFFGKDCNDAKRVETMVRYVREQMQQLDIMTEEQFRARQIKWIPLKKV